MAYRVRLTERAEHDLAQLFDYVHAAESEAAFRWYEGPEREILSLKKHPYRFPTTPENKDFRHLLYGRKPHVYRIIYRVLEHQKQVDVLHIRHGAQREFSGRDIS